jgi:hypothetical protein
MKYMMRAAYFEAGSGNFEKEEKKISTCGPLHQTAFVSRKEKRRKRTSVKVLPRFIIFPSSSRNIHL